MQKLVLEFTCWVDSPDREFVERMGAELAPIIQAHIMASHPLARADVLETVLTDAQYTAAMEKELNGGEVGNGVQKNIT
jgi:hypothetical protein